MDGHLARAGAQVSFTVWGPNDAPGPPLLALHGLSSNKLFWTRTARELPHRRIVAIDQRGHGRTGDAPRYEPQDFVDDAVAVLDTLGIERAVVAGHSWGSSVALAFAATRADRTAALLFADGGLWPMREGTTWDDVARRSQPPFARWPSIEGSVEELAGFLGEAWADDLIPFAHNGVTRHADGWGCVLTQESRYAILRSFWDSHAADQHWPRVRTPALLAIALRKRPEMLERARRAVDLVKDVASHVTVRWYDSPHDIPLYLPREFSADLDALIDLADGARTAT